MVTNFYISQVSGGYIFMVMPLAKMGQKARIRFKKAFSGCKTVLQF
jgi:hypothetical protein